jgi:hypothetical protein
VKYKGYNIQPWTGPLGETPDQPEPKWYVETLHEKTGLPEFPPLKGMRFRSIRAAREKINEMVSHE